jgi:hypothetical protein
MAICYGIKVLVCDVCGKKWLPDGKKMPVQCPNRDCRSRRWNESGEVFDSPEDIVEPQAAPPANPDSIGALMARLGMTTASKLHEKPSEPIHIAPVEDEEPTIPMCDYKEYDGESGEWYRCGLRDHSNKVKHTRGNRV